MLPEWLLGWGSGGREAPGMSKARLVITAVTVEKRPVSEVAKSYGVARSWICKLLARYEAEGEAAFEPRSRRPKTSPSATSDDTVELIVRLRKELAGQAAGETFSWWCCSRCQAMVCGPASRPCPASSLRSRVISSTVPGAVTPGEFFGRLDRGSNAASPSARYQATSRDTQLWETP